MNRRTRKGFLSKFFSSKVCLCPRQRPLIQRIPPPPRYTGHGRLRSCRCALQWILTSTQWRGGEERWVSKVGALTAVAWMQKKKSATSVHPLVGSERQFSICTFVKVTHVPLLANWSGKVANHESFGEIWWIWIWMWSRIRDILLKPNCWSKIKNTHWTTIFQKMHPCSIWQNVQNVSLWI